MKVVLTLLVLSTLTLLTGCEDSTFHEDKVFAGGVYATASDLNRGKSIYTEYCMACHGVKGDGKGVASKGMNPIPRDFTLGKFKFGNVLSGELPNDADFGQIIKKGLHGTAMLPWDLSDVQVRIVMQYIKTFAPAVWEGKDKTLGAPIIPTRDPYGLAHRDSAILRGKKVYHVVAQCWTCHRAYDTKENISNFNKEINNEPIKEFDATMYDVKPQDSDYGVKTTPPDFTWHSVRSAKSVEELYIRITAGVGGTAMPSWKDTLSDDDVWAVSHYVHYLMDFKDNPKRYEFLDAVKK
jgi:mono/diheme cytochrome c family protein